MNEDAALDAVRAVVEGNKSTLVSGLEQNSLAREISWISDNPCAFPDAYYAVKIFAEPCTEEDVRQSNAVKSTGMYVSQYNILLRVADFVTIVPEDETYGETAVRNFRKLSDRIVGLVRRTTDWFPVSTESPKFRLIDRRVTKTPHPAMLDTNGYLIGCDIRFRLVGCND